MNRFALRVVLALAAVVAVGCKSSSTVDAGPPSAFLSVHASPQSIVNNGAQTTIHVSATDAANNPGVGSVTLSAAHGTFGTADSGSGSVTLDATGEGDIVYACNVANDPGCTGSQTITATWSDQTATTHVTLTATAGGACDDVNNTLTFLGFTKSPLAVATGGTADSTLLTVQARFASGLNADGCTVTAVEQTGESLVVLPVNSAIVQGGIAQFEVDSTAAAGVGHIVVSLGQKSVVEAITVGQPVDSGPVITCDPTGGTLNFTSASTVTISPAGQGSTGSDVADLTVVARLSGGEAAAGCIVHFAEQAGENLLLLSGTDVVVGADGTATISVSSEAFSGTGHVVITYGTQTLTAVVNVSSVTDSGSGDGCNQAGSTLNLVSLTPSTIQPQNQTGVNTATLTVVARQPSGDAATGCTVHFAEQAGENLVLLGANDVVVGPDGTAAVQVSSETFTGIAHITATFGAQTLSETVTVGAASVIDAGSPVPTTLLASGVTPAQISLAGTGQNSSGNMTFQVVDQHGTAVPGVTVDFVPASTVDGGSPYINLVNSSDVSGNTGNVTVSYNAKSNPGVAGVIATIRGTNITAQQTVVVAGGLPSARNFSFFCDKHNLPIYAADNRDLSTTCEVYLADRFNNPVSGVKVFFGTEAGIIDQSATTDISGHATVNFQSTPALLPVDVEPLAAATQQYPAPRTKQEPRWSFGSLTHNPRDGLVTLIAMTQGEEALFAADPSRGFDASAGDIFYDLGDPYIDSNDDNAWDTVTDGGALEQRYCGAGVLCQGGEPYHSPNGTWDSNTLIWTTAHVTFTGAGLTSDIGADNFPSDGGYIRTSGFPGCLGTGSTAAYNLYTYDENLNAPASGSSMSVTAVGQGMSATIVGGGTALDSFGSNPNDALLAGYAVNADDGGACVQGSAGACVLHTYFTDFLNGMGTTVQVSNGNSPPAACAEYAVIFNVSTPLGNGGGTVTSSSSVSGSSEQP